MLNRRTLIQAPLLLSAFMRLPRAQAAAATKLILLGTQGGPNANLKRAETASLLLINDQPYLIDCGYGTLRGLVASGVSYLTVGHIFLSHLHDDHNADLPALLGHQWTQGRVKPTRIFGPYGTDSLVQAANLYNQANTDIRLVDEARSVLPNDMFVGTVVAAAASPVVVLENADVKITAIENTHYPEESKSKTPHRSLAYRFDMQDRSVVFSGDTNYSENLVKLAKGADLFVCEVIEVAVSRANFEKRVKNGYYADNPEGIWHHIVGTHTSTEDAGRMAAAAGVKTLVFSHVLPGGLEDLADEVYVKNAGKHFNGKIIVGKDQMVL